jgi:AraC family transcriptional regulator
VGAYAFERKPDYQRELEGLPNIDLVRDAGTRPRWNMPVVLWHSPNGYGEESEVEIMPNSCIAVALSGEIECVKGGAPGRRSDSRGDLISLFRTGDPNLYVTRSKFRFAHLNFTDDFWRSIAAEVTDRSSESAELLADRVFVPDRETRTLVDAYLARALGQDLPSTLEMDCRANLVALALVQRHSSLSPGISARRLALTPRRLARAKEFIEAHLADDFNLKAVAAAVDLSPFHFARAFKRETGLPPHRYLMERRVELARSLLADAEISLAQIALACGFAGQSHFTTAFRRCAGMTPGAWRNMLTAH